MTQPKKLQEVRKKIKRYTTDPQFQVTKGAVDSCTTQSVEEDTAGGTTPENLKECEHGEVPEPKKQDFVMTSCIVIKIKLLSLPYK